MKRGLLLEGGAMRGLFTAGVLDVFLKHELSFDVTVGVSAGAAFGCNLKSHQAGRVLRYNTAYCRDKRYCSLHSLLTTGDLYGADFCYRAIPNELDRFDYETYRADPMDFYAVCTDVHTGKPCYFLCNDLNEDEFLYLRASASMPIVSRAVEVGGMHLLDGGISDSIPYAFLNAQNCDRQVLVLTQPAGFRKKPISVPFLKFFLRKMPEVYRALKVRHEHYNAALDTIAELEAAGKVFVLRPSTAIDVHNVERSKERLTAAWQMGQATAESRLDELSSYLKQ